MAYDAGSTLTAARQDTTALVRKLGQDTDLLSALAKAVAPFSLSYQKSGLASDLVGDKPAVIFADHLARLLQAALANRGTPLDANTLHALVDQAMDEVLKHDLTLRLEGILQPVRPYSMTQLAFVYDLLDRDLPLVFGVGPTGTGKTYLAIAAALNQLENGTVKHIMITKPHEMLQGEQMTPAKWAEKARDEQFDVYFDILSDFIGQDAIHAMIDRRQLEIAPLGLLRGRTLTDSIILIDEAQNIDKRWMRLAVTRAGQNSRTFITGNPTHSTLPSDEVNGLAHLLKMLDGHEIGRVHKFVPKDIVRNDTVAQLEALYEEAAASDVELALDRN